MAPESTAEIPSLDCSSTGLNAGKINEFLKRFASPWLLDAEFYNFVSSARDKRPVFLPDAIFYPQEKAALCMEVKITERETITVLK